jgi:D-3-phosphoglycerate dehydrogenase
VGQRVARLCLAFGTHVIANDIREYPEFYRETGVEPVPLDTLLRDADIVTLHVPLDASTRGLIGARELASMKREAVLINTARGGIVDEDALASALREGRLAGAAADVFAIEPPVGSQLLSCPTFVGTPHIGASTTEAVLAMGRAAIAGLDCGPESIDLTTGCR